MSKTIEKREIKFRAWDEEYSIEDGMHYDIFIVNGLIYIPVDYLPADEDDKSSRFEQRRGQWYYITSAKDFKVMQYTGLKDKNGNEIYEDDILKHPNDAKSIVYWHGYKWDYKMIQGSLLSYPEINNLLEVEIIGNIHEA